MQFKPFYYLPILVLGFGLAYADPGDLCHETFSNNPCGILDSPFDAMMNPFDAVIPGFGVILLWGPIVFAIWLSTKSTAITGVIGVLISVTVTGLHPQAVGLGLMLMVVSFAIMIFQLFPRVKQAV